MVIEVRRYVAADLAAILDLCTTEGWTADRGAVARATHALTAPEAATFVAELAGRVVGFAHLLGDGSNLALLTTLRVAEGQEGQGIGTALMVEAYRSAGDMRLEVVAEADVPFYERRLSPD